MFHLPIAVACIVQFLRIICWKLEMKNFINSGLNFLGTVPVPTPVPT